MRFLLLLAVSALPLAAQPASDSALVARIYADIARGDVEAVVAVLDDHVLWIEGAHGLPDGRHFGPATVAARVLRPQAAAGAADVLDAITPEVGRLVAVGTTHRTDPATGRLVAARFRHVWRVLDGRVVSVHRSAEGADRSASNGCGPQPC